MAEASTNCLVYWSWFRLSHSFLKVWGRPEMESLVFLGLQLKDQIMYVIPVSGQCASEVQYQIWSQL